MLLPALVCLATTLVALIYMKWLAPDLGLIERPHGHRTHDLPTPVVGGIGMATGIFVTWMAAGMSEPGMPVALGAFGLVVIGLWDDRHGLPARRKFAAQAAVVAIAVFFDGDLLRTLGPLLPGVDVRLGALALPFTVFAVLGLINAVNMIDGLDGLAGKVMLSAFGWLATCMWMVGGMARLTSNLAIIGAIFAFLLFNARFPGRPRALLFMGDTGSMLLGYLLAIAAIDATQRAPGIPPVTALWICALPILDTLSVTVRASATGARRWPPGATTCTTCCGRTACRSARRCSQKRPSPRRRAWPAWPDGGSAWPTGSCSRASSASDWPGTRPAGSAGGACRPARRRS